MDTLKSIDYFSLNAAFIELDKAGKIELAEKIKNIIENNQLPKSENHNHRNDIDTSYFKVELNDEDFIEITDLFFALEISSLDKNYEATTKTYHYVNLANKWLKLSNGE